MKSFVFVCLALAVVTFSSAEDDGRYRPEKYGGDDGRYRHTDGSGDDGRYYGSRFGNYFGTNSKYSSIYAAYQPQFFNQFTPYQDLAAPGIVDNSIEYSPGASAVSAVRYQPVTARPFAPARLPSYYTKSQYAPDAYARILRQDQDLSDNAYHYAYQTENGISAEESGRVEAPTGGTRASGFYEYIGDDGVKYRVDYIADENGFQPRGAHLPQ